MHRATCRPRRIAPAIAAFGTGILLLLGFALPPLIALAGVPPLRVLRRDLPRPRPGGLLAYALGAAVIAALIGWQAQDTKTGAIVVAGIGGLLVAAALAAWLLIALLKRLPQRGVTWRFGLANLRRRPLASSLQVGALALGLMALLLLTVVRGDLLSNWRASLPPDAPNHFLVNVLPDQVDGVRAALKAVTGTDTKLYPMVRGRIVAVNGQPFDTTKFETRARRLAEREFNLSWATDLPKTNRVTAGKWFDGATGPEAGLSMEEGIAESLHFKLGDALTWDLAGATVTAKITSLRKVEWDSFRPNFFALFAPGVLEAAPQTYLGAVRAPDGGTWLSALVQQYPNLLVIDVGEIIRQIQMIIEQVARAVEFVFLFTLVGGLLVLQAAIAATQDERRFDAAILRTLGASQAQLRAAQVAEFLVLGALAGLLAAAGATAVGLRALRSRLSDSVRVEPAGLDLRMRGRRGRGSIGGVDRHAGHGAAAAARGHPSTRLRHAQISRIRGTSGAWRTQHDEERWSLHRLPPGARPPSGKTGLGAAWCSRTSASSTGPRASSRVPPMCSSWATSSGRSPPRRLPTLRA